MDGNVNVGASFVNLFEMLGTFKVINGFDTSWQHHSQRSWNVKNVLKSERSELSLNYLLIGD